MSFPSEEPAPEGVRVQLRMRVSHPPEERFDQNGTALLQLRGSVIDGQTRHPQVVVRFKGQHRAELYRWAAPDKHLSVDGHLEVKTWASNGVGHVALLIEALNIYPLGELEPDLGKIGVYALPGVSSTSTRRAPRRSKTERAETLRRELDEA